MKNMTERTEIPKTQAGTHVSRGQFLRNAGEAALGVATLGVIAAAGGITVARQEQASETLIGKDVRGESLGHFVTDPFDGEEAIPLRKSPTQTDDGRVWTRPGFEFWAQPEYGVVYFTPQEDQFRVKADGENYGVWFRGAGLPIFQKDEQGKLVAVTDKNGQQMKSGTVHIAGNYVKRAPVENSQG